MSDDPAADAPGGTRGSDGDPAAGGEGGVDGPDGTTAPEEAADPAAGGDAPADGRPPSGGPDVDPIPEDDAGADADLLVSERRTPKGLLVAVCDAETLGETYEDGDVTLSVTEDFYGGDPAGEDAVRESLARASVGNVVGRRAVSVAVEAGVVDERNVLVVEGVPHAQFLTL